MPQGGPCGVVPTMDLASKRVVVMGLGRFGGGVGVSRFLVGQGADVLVTDLEPEDRLAKSLSRLEGLSIDLRLGGQNVADFTTADLVVVNPAVDPRNNRFLRAATARCGAGRVCNAVCAPPGTKTPIEPATRVRTDDPANPRTESHPFGPRRPATCSAECAFHETVASLICR